MVNTIHVLPVAAGCLLQLVTVGTKNSDWRFNDVSHCRLYTLCAREAIHYLLYLYRSPPPFLSILPPAHPPTSPSLHTAARRRPAGRAAPPRLPPYPLAYLLRSACLSHNNEQSIPKEKGEAVTPPQKKKKRLSENQNTPVKSEELFIKSETV